MNKVLGYRKMLGHTQQEMADILGMSLATYRNKEVGVSGFKKSEMEKFLKEVQKYDSTVSIEDIFF